MKSKLRIVSRSSKLALKQVEIFCNKLSKKFDFEIIKIQTSADKILDKPLYELGGKGLFTKELEECLLKNIADIAVHSLKDMDNNIAKGTTLLAVLKRESRNDVFVSNYKNLSFLPFNAVIGTSSPRRTAFIKAYRKDLKIKSCRGNIDTRLNKLKEGQYDALILAKAGMKRMKLKFTNVIPISILPPPAGQGVIAIQCSNLLNKKSKDDLHKLVNDEKTFYETLAERSLVKHLNGSCRSPISSSANINKAGILTLKGYVADIKGSKIIYDSFFDNYKNAKRIGEKLAKNLIRKGANKILGL